MLRWCGFSAGVMLSLFVMGCGDVDLRDDVSKLKAELTVVQTELQTLKAAERASVAHELERLDNLRQKGIVTDDEFASMKQRVLTPNAAKPVSSTATMTELAAQLKTLDSLYNTNAINGTERDAKRDKLVSGPLVPVDLKTDLETVQSLYNTNTIRSTDRDRLKQRLLEIDPVK